MMGCFVCQGDLKPVEGCDNQVWKITISDLHYALRLLYRKDFSTHNQMKFDLSSPGDLILLFPLNVFKTMIYDTTSVIVKDKSMEIEK